MGKRYVYHVHAIYQGSRHDILKHYDGITDTSAPIDNIEQYRDTKRGIAKEMGVPEESAMEVIIDAFSFLHTRRS